MAVLCSVLNCELRITNYESFAILGLSLLRYCQATDKKGYMYFINSRGTNFLVVMCQKPKSNP